METEAADQGAALVAARETPAADSDEHRADGGRVPCRLEEVELEALDRSGLTRRLAVGAVLVSVTEGNTSSR